MIKFAPSLLSADFANLSDELKLIENSGAEYVHLDVMDGHFVPNITIGPPVIHSLRPISNIVFDVHLMISEPEKYIDAFIDAGADIITIHIEASKDLLKDIEKIKTRGKRAAVALNPGTEIESVYPYVSELDMVLVMSVNPGFGGQKFMPIAIEKIQKLSEYVKKHNISLDIQVDGGISLENSNLVISAGANVIVSGSAFFKSASKEDFVKSIKNM